jgi:DNA-binding response OmpR family regulator
MIPDVVDVLFRIAVADDDPLLLERIRSNLIADGYGVEAVPSALETLYEAQAIAAGQKGVAANLAVVRKRIEDLKRKPSGPA